jgi:FixJ family two-component response regulator
MKERVPVVCVVDDDTAARSSPPTLSSRTSMQADTWRPGIGGFG